MTKTSRTPGHPGAELDRRARKDLARRLDREWKNWLPSGDGRVRPEHLLRAMTADGAEHAIGRRRAILRQEVWRLLVTAREVAAGDSEAIQRVEVMLLRIGELMQKVGMEEGRAAILTDRIRDAFAEVRGWPLR